MKNKLKALWLRINPINKKVKKDLSEFQNDFQLMEDYRFDDDKGKAGYKTFMYVGRSKFIDVDRKFWFHTINERKREKEQYGKAKHWYYKRRFFHFHGGQAVAIEGASGWPNRLSFKISWGGDYDLQFSFWFIVTWYFSVQRLPKKFMERFKARLPQYEYAREISFSIHHWAFWWNIWRDDNSWSNKVPKWRNGSFHPIDKIRGRDKVTTKYDSFKRGRIYFKEGGYDLVSIKQFSKRKYKRFGFLFNKKWMRFEVVAGSLIDVKSIDDIESYSYVFVHKHGEVIEDMNDNYNYYVAKVGLDGLKKNSNNAVDKENGMVRLDDGNSIHWSNIRKVIKSVGIPTPGKGTAAYNCGQDATYSISFGQDVKSFDDAFSGYHKSIMKDRSRRASSEWVPENEAVA